MAAKKWIRRPGEEFDTSETHGRYVTINMGGQDVGYARVGIVSSDRDYMLFRFRGRTGLAAKNYITEVVEVRMTERMREKEEPVTAAEWEGGVNPFSRFVGIRCDIHMHQTRMFEATPGFFGAKILYVDERNNIIRIRENGSQFNISIPMICGILESYSSHGDSES